MRKNIMEAIGTFFLVMAVGFTGNPLAIGLTLAIMIYCGGHISGGHYNPAVSLAIFLRKGIKSNELVSYWIFQVVGAALAALTYSFINSKTFAPAPGAGVRFDAALLIEILGTFALAFVVLSVATASKLKGNFVYGFAIGLTVTCMAFIGGAISGGAFNPAVALGPILVEAIHGGSLSNLALYLVGPFGGATIAAFTFGYLNQE